MEINMYVEMFPHRNVRIFMHPNAVALVDDDIRAERDLTEKNGSTAQGAGAAVVRKIQRRSNIQQTTFMMLESMGLEKILCSHDQYQWELRQCHNILLEGAQGYSLGLNQKFHPFCTSRDCTPAKFFADCAVPIQWLRSTFGVMRVHPIRVGGNSGPIYEDHNEIDWETLGVTPERTTVTNRVRRVFTPSFEQTREAVMECMPDWIFLNFCNYDPALATDMVPQINAIMEEYVAKGARVRWTGWGPHEKDIHEIEPIQTSE
jgi:adenylosuccinate synthase